MNVLLSAYACEPGKGSEPGVGWRWANGLASRVNLHVLTREGNRGAITRAVSESDSRAPIRAVRFIYHDLPPVALWLKRRGWLPTAAYYVLWQFSARRRFNDLAESMDVVHHLTFCNLLCPGFWRLQQAAFVIGPVGAPLVPEAYLPLFGKSAPLQRIRAIVLRNFHRLPWLKRVLLGASAIIPANSDTKSLLENHGFSCRNAMLDTGAPELDAVANPGDPRCIRFISAGRLERRKGLELALRAFALASPQMKNWTFTIVGDGPDARRLRNLATDLGIADTVEFTGAVSRDSTLGQLGNSDVFVFTSIRDTSGSVNLEAMASGLPIICIAHQGVGDITDESCAIRVPPGSVEDTIQGLSRAMIQVAGDSAFREQLARCAISRATRQFSWDAKFDEMVGHYHNACNKATDVVNRTCANRTPQVQ